jgi:putative selenate reductase
MDEPLAIREIKRFVMEHEDPDSSSIPDRRSGPQVAVVGAGPCGLSAASRLARAGVPVTVFEARPASGGMVSGTIPGYRAAQHVIDQDLESIEGLGVQVRHGQEIGRTLTLQGLREQGFGPVVVAVGARLGIRLGIEGEDADGVWDGLDFLRAARAGTAGPIDGRVGVVGGGDAAIDCARTAHRLGAREVLILYRRSVDEMPAQAEEVRALAEEGIVVCERLTPLRVLAPTGKVETVVCAATTPGEPDPDGRRRPVAVPDSELEVPLDRLIVAIGQRVDPSVFGDQRVKVNAAGFVEVHPTTHETSLEGVYAGGDLVGSGPATIVDACGHGLRIAAAILDRNGIRDDTPVDNSAAVEPVDILRRRARRRFRVEIPELPAGARNDFDEVVRTLTPDAATAEADRCLDCDLLCSTCEWVCPNRAIVTYRISGAPISLPVPVVNPATGAVSSTARFEVVQGFQVAVLADLCNECGNCVTFCPTSGRPHRDKPKLYLHRGGFDGQRDNAVLLFRRESSWGARSWMAGALHEVILQDGVLHCTAGDLELTLDPDSFTVLDSRPGAGDAPMTDLRGCAALWILLRGIIGSLSWLPVAELDDRNPSEPRTSPPC